MIGDDTDGWTTPTVHFFYDGPLREDVLQQFCSALSDWNDFGDPREPTTIVHELNAEGRALLVDEYTDLNLSIWADQAGAGKWDRLSEIKLINVRASNLDGDRWFEFVVDLYRRSVDVGRRPIYPLVTHESDRYYVPPFTEQSILSGEVYRLGWIHVFTPSQVDTLGRDRIETAPATRIEQLDDDSIAFALTLGDFEQRDRVAAHLGIDAPVGEEWFDDLDHEIDLVRHRAARRIRSLALNGEIGAEPVLDHLDAHDPTVRFTLTQALRNVSGNEVEAALRHLAEADADEAVRGAAVSVIGQGETAKNALWDVSPRVQRSGLRTLYRCPDERTLRRTVELLDSDDTLVREEAAEKIQSEMYVEPLPEDAIESARQALRKRR